MSENQTTKPDWPLVLACLYLLLVLWNMFALMKLIVSHAAGYSVPTVWELYRLWPLVPSPTIWR